MGDTSEEKLETWQAELSRWNELDEHHPGNHEQGFVVEACFAEWVRAVKLEGKPVSHGVNPETLKKDLPRNLRATGADE